MILSAYFDSIVYQDESKSKRNETLRMKNMDGLLRRIRGKQQEAWLQSFKNSVRTNAVMGNVKIEVIAFQMGISARTLQRKLDEHNIKFGEFVNQEKIKLILLMIQQGKDYGEIADVLGYSSTRNLKRFMNNHYEDLIMNCDIFRNENEYILKEA